ncbi:MAG: NAD-dependent epimerase/dehydratase family protein [Planctomycetota bacterium]|jgi:UDP-glucuronate 4-epimerase
MKALVTGAAGFIGSHLSERLVNEGWEVVGVDNFDDFYDPRIKRRNIEGLVKDNGFQLLEADIRDTAAMDGAVGGGIDIIVHLAARAGVRPSIAKPLLYADVNINGTLVLLEAAKEHGIEKFIFGSSSSVYGNNEKVPFSEDDNVGISITCLRFFTVYGPRQRPDLAIHKFARLIEEGKPIPVYGDGTMMRDFTYVDDIVNGTAAAMEKCSGFNIYNLGESRPIAVNDLINEIEKALGKKAIKEYQPAQTYADVGKAVGELGYNPSTTIESGLERFVKWLRVKR